MKITVLNVIHGTDSDRAIIEQARQLILQVCSTKLFADKLIAANLTETGGLTNAQVLQNLDNMDLQITLCLYDKWWSKVVGYTYFATNTIYVNRKFFHGVIGIASNMLHEMSHILGFPHRGVWATSVPYTLNRIFEECCLELHFPAQTVLAPAPAATVS